MLRARRPATSSCSRSISTREPSRLPDAPVRPARLGRGRTGHSTHSLGQRRYAAARGDLGWRRRGGAAADRCRRGRERGGRGWLHADPRGARPVQRPARAAVDGVRRFVGRGQRVCLLGARRRAALGRSGRPRAARTGRAGQPAAGPHRPLPARVRAPQRSLDRSRAPLSASRVRSTARGGAGVASGRASGGRRSVVPLSKGPSSHCSSPRTSASSSATRSASRRRATAARRRRSFRWSTACPPCFARRCEANAWRSSTT